MPGDDPLMILSSGADSQKRAVLTNRGIAFVFSVAVTIGCAVA